VFLTCRCIFVCHGGSGLFCGLESSLETKHSWRWTRPKLKRLAQLSGFKVFAVFVCDALQVMFGFE
jgi:hypothetical protein